MRERRIRNRLLMRELLLRREAERFSVPGRSGEATIYFRRWTRHMLLRNPRFAVKYLLANRSDRREAIEGRQSRPSAPTPDLSA